MDITQAGNLEGYIIFDCFGANLAVIPVVAKSFIVNRKCRGMAGCCITTLYIADTERFTKVESRGRSFIKYAQKLGCSLAFPTMLHHVHPRPRSIFMPNLGLVLPYTRVSPVAFIARPIGRHTQLVLLLY